MIILIKNYCNKKKRYGTKRLLAEFLNKTFATHNCEASAAEDRRHCGMVNTHLASGRKRKVNIKQKYSKISVTFC